MTTPELLARAHGLTCSGAFRCFYCGAACDSSHRAADWRSDGFNDWSSVPFPSSSYICAGCALALDEQLVMPGRDKLQRRRSYSWLVTASRAEPYTKGDLAALRKICLAPPTEAWSLTLAVSGQRQLLWRTPVNEGGEPFCVQLELERVSFRTDALAQRLNLASRLAAAIGKPALSEDLRAGHALALGERYGDEAGDLIDSWSLVRDEPLSRLALFLCPNKEASALDHPSLAGAC